LVPFFDLASRYFANVCSKWVPKFSPTAPPTQWPEPPCGFFFFFFLGRFDPLIPPVLPEKAPVVPTHQTPSSLPPQKSGIGFVSGLVEFSPSWKTFFAHTVWVFSLIRLVFFPLRGSLLVVGILSPPLQRGFYPFSPWICRTSPLLIAVHQD